MQEPKTTQETIAEMEQGKSLLLSFGSPGQRLKRNIRKTGVVCRFVLFLVFNPFFLLRAKLFPGAWQSRRRGAVKIIKVFLPFIVKGNPNNCVDAQIMVINHPTLNDPICTLLYALAQNPRGNVIAPVNLPWFETMARYRSKMLKMGLNIVPILTPETAKRLSGSPDSDDKQVTKVSAALMKNYVTELISTLDTNGVAIVAQQATRKRYLFTSEEQAQNGESILATVSFILDGLRRKGLSEKVTIVPIGVIPPHFGVKPKLNLFSKYTLNIGESITAAELAAVKNDAKRPADLYVLLKLKELLPEEYHFGS